MSRWAIVFCAALIALVFLSGYGIVSEKLLEQPVWHPEGKTRLAWFTAAFGLASAALIAIRPGWYRPTLLALVAASTVLAAGAPAVATLALFLLGSFVLGGMVLEKCGSPLDDLLALLIGISAFAMLIGLAAHFRINYAPVYLAGFAAPLLARPRSAVRAAARTAGFLRPAAQPSRRETAALALLAFVLAAHWLVALKPEASSDGLAMHLALPSIVAQQHYWAFDFERLVWAVMPMLGDWAYTAVYLPGGESAARLLNFALLTMLAGVLFFSMEPWTGRIPAWLAVALFCSTPLVQLETGSMFVENLWAALLTGALAALWRFRQTQSGRFLLASGILMGAAIQTKVGAFASLVPTAALAVWLLRRTRNPHRLKIAAASLLALALFAAPPYATAYAKTRNPVFPFANSVFQSPYFESGESFVDRRFQHPVSWNALYTLTMNTDRFLEAQRGAMGFHYLLLLPLLLLLLGRRWPFEAGTAALFALVFFVLTFRASTNLRYVYPALALTTLPVGWLFSSTRQRSRSAYALLISAALVAFAVNVAFLAASGWYHKDFVFNVLDPAARADYLVKTAPVRPLIAYMNQKHPGAPVMLVESSDMAGATGRVDSTSWHHHSFRRDLLAASDAVELLRLFDRLNIRYFIRPNPESGIPSSMLMLESFLDEFTEPELPGRTYSVAKLREKFTGAEAVESLANGVMKLTPGVYDDTSARLRFRGRWLRDRQFEQAAAGSLTYSSHPGDSLALTFTGESLEYVYTRALNRGIAEVRMDGQTVARIDLYTKETSWQTSTSFHQLGPGDHLFELRVTGDKNPAASDSFVDVDRLVIR